MFEHLTYSLNSSLGHEIKVGQSAIELQHSIVKGHSIGSQKGQLNIEFETGHVYELKIQFHRV